MAPSSPLDAENFRRGARERAFARLVVLRLTVAPVLGVLALTFAFFEPTFWRRAVLVSAIAMFLTLTLVEWVRFRRRGLGTLQVPLNFLAMVLGQMALVTATGGLFSPLVPAIILMTVLGAIMLERPALFAILGLVDLPAFWALAFVHAEGVPVPSLIPRVFGEAGQLERGPAPFVAAGIFSFALFLGSRLGLEIRSIFESTFDEGIRERDRALAMHAEQSRALTSLGGEIAHELKNPLASVKGLATLVARSADGKAAERLAVLRREVDRMQGILEELLDFSRPLVPLSMEDVDLVELTDDVARLHEGTAAGRAVRISVTTEAPVRLRCDPRKVRQVLINLVQNALEASPSHAVVELAVRGDERSALVTVSDRGAGLAPDVAERAFDAGVTTKEKGSGLGLSVARSLARQHGGELRLENRRGGGSRAELSLPVAPAEDGP